MAAKLSLRPWDVAFIAVVASMLVGIAILGVASYRAAHDLEKLKRGAELVASRLATLGAARAAGSEQGACARLPRGSGGGNWGECFAVLRQAPDISAIANVFVPDNPVFAKACSTDEPGARGTIVVEKGTEWFSAGTSGTTYAPLADGEELDKEIPLRVRVCGRWGEPVTVREARF
ncbi:MAG: hypothetical protein ACKOUS_06885 [Alphaproteobacteria bacterium]